MTPLARDVASGHKHSPHIWALTPPLVTAVPGGVPPDISPAPMKDPPGILMWPEAQASAVLSPSPEAAALSISGANRDFWTALHHIFQTLNFRTYKLYRLKIYPSKTSEFVFYLWEFIYFKNVFGVIYAWCDSRLQTCFNEFGTFTVYTQF